MEILSDRLSSIRLTKLDLHFSRGFTGSLSVLFSHSFPSLNTLILLGCDLNTNDVQSLTRANVEGKLPELRHLDVSHNKVEISDLFTHSFPRLDTLILIHCELYSQDLRSLANVDGKLPQLEYLDISKNGNVEISDLFTNSAKWHQLTFLKTSDESILNIEPEFLTSLEELQLSWGRGPKEIPRVTRRWSV